MSAPLATAWGAMQRKIATDPDTQDWPLTMVEGLRAMFYTGAMVALTNPPAAQKEVREFKKAMGYD